ncbi:MAG: flavodoxin domain-containing protein [Candidatus Bathyarchaeia archaeon]
MPRILVLYYSRSGNTEKMAKAVAEGAKNAGNAEVELSYHVDADDLANFDAIILGAPTYHHDTPMDMKRLFEDAAAKGMNLKGKVGAAFGSYGWSGEAPKMLLEIMKNKFEMQVIEPPLLVKYAPDEKALSMCRELGKRVAETLMHKA